MALRAAIPFDLIAFRGVCPWNVRLRAHGKHALSNRWNLRAHLALDKVREVFPLKLHQIAHSEAAIAHQVTKVIRRQDNITVMLDRNADNVSAAECAGIVQINLG
ncbi:MAG: hypothetical protein AAFR33_11270, partial [Pseudomonadota bacterium]